MKRQLTRRTSGCVSELSSAGSRGSVGPSQSDQTEPISGGVLCRPLINVDLLPAAPGLRRRKTQPRHRVPNCNCNARRGTRRLLQCRSPSPALSLSLAASPPPPSPLPLSCAPSCHQSQRPGFIIVIHASLGNLTRPTPKCRPEIPSNSFFDPPPNSNPPNPMST